MSSHLYTKSSLYKSKLNDKPNEGLTDAKPLDNDIKVSDDVDKQSEQKVESISDAALSIWRCPKCRSGLYLNDGVWSCENKHSFDLARQGYTNLLLANKKGSNEPGDNREMIDARRNFLRKDFYIDLVKALHTLYLKEYNRTQTDLASQDLKGQDLNSHEPNSHEPNNDSPKNNHDELDRADSPQDFCVADLGCGEGYYLDTIVNTHSSSVSDSHTFDSLEHAVKTFSIDISKTAVQRAAVAYSERQRSRTRLDQTNHLNNDSLDTSTNKTSSYFAVASSYDVPLFDHSMNILCAIFSPVSDAELDRLLLNDGCFIRVSPGPRHFHQLKERLYTDVTLHKIPEPPEGFFLDEEQSVSFDLHLNNRSDIENLLLMTPLNWHGNMSAKNEILNEPVFFTECDFIIQVFRKNRPL